MNVFPNASVSALTNICSYSAFHAEAPMRLEAIIEKNCDEYYKYKINSTISFKDMIKEIVDDIQANTPVSIISAKFHNTIISVIFDVVKEMSNRFNISNIVLSGGTFQNKYLIERCENILAEEGLHVFTHSRIPSNDGGIALGQLAIAAKRRELKCV